jgi:hypothetical protein
MRASQPEAAPQPEPKMNNMIAIALLCSRGEPITTEEDVERLFQARASKTVDRGMLNLLEMAKVQLMGDVGSLCGNIGKVVKPAVVLPKAEIPNAMPKEMPKAVPKAMPEEIPRAMPEAMSIQLAKAMPTPQAAATNSDIVGEIRKIFAEEFEEKQGHYLTFGEIFSVFLRCKGMVTDQDQRQFRFYCKALFLEQWPNARHCVHAKKRSYVNVCVKN